MHLFLIRHTQVALPSGICYGASDVELAESFTTESESIIEKLKHLSFPVVYSSPLMRCRMLANKLSSHVIIDNRLKELNFGQWELKPWDHITGPEAEKWMNDFVNTPCPQGESYLNLCTRVETFLADMDRTLSDPMLIVTHAGVIRAFISIIKNIEALQTFKIQIDFGEIIELEIQ